MNQQQRAVVQQALEALIYASSYCDTYPEIESLRQLLEQPEPVFCEYCGGNDDADFGLPTDHCTDCARPQPAQPADHSEQDLDMVENGDLLTIVYMDGLHTGKRMAKREWVGLTEEDLYAVRVPMSPEEIARAVEAKLKEKNT